MKQTPACVLFSGGADSTLAAVKIKEHHHPVHLLSFTHNHMSQEGKTNHTAGVLRNHFGEDAFIQHWMDMTTLWRSIRCMPPGKSLGFRGLFAGLLKPCLACKVAMHRLAVSYCLEHRIPVLADGSHPDGADKFPEQLPEGIECLRAYYQRYDIHYQTPVYDIGRPDFHLFQMGITTKKNTKDEHVYYTNQFACHVGLLAHAYHHLTRPLDRRKRKTFRLSLQFLEQGLKDD